MFQISRFKKFLFSLEDSGKLFIWLTELAQLQILIVTIHRKLTCIHPIFTHWTTFPYFTWRTSSWMRKIHRIWILQNCAANLVLLFFTNAMVLRRWSIDFTFFFKLNSIRYQHFNALIKKKVSNHYFRLKIRCKKSVLKHKGIKKWNMMKIILQNCFFSLIQIQWCQ